MSDVVVQVSGIGKRYWLGASAGQRTIHHDIARLIATPLRRLAGRSKPEEYFWALRDVAFEARRGEVIGIIGRNGSGKSTLLKILARITPPTTGQIRMRGRVAALLEVGTGFHPELTGRENVYLNGILLGMTKRQIDRLLEPIVEFAEVQAFIDTPVKRYSSGMYVRLAFSVSAHLESDIVILDEVLAVGDAIFQRKCHDQVVRLAQSGRTVLIVSHNMLAIQAACSRGILLDQGAILKDEAMATVVNHYTDMDINRSGETEWPDSEAGPHFPDGSIRLTAIRALGRDEKIRDTFDVSEPIDIEVEYRVCVQRHVGSAHLYFRNQVGQTVFVAMDNQGSPWRGLTQPEGLYRARCHIPANLLNHGSYRIEYLVCTNPTTEQYVTQSDALTLTLTDRLETDSARGDWAGEWPAAASRPRLRWEHSTIDGHEFRRADVEVANAAGQPEAVA